MHSGRCVYSQRALCISTAPAVGYKVPSFLPEKGHISPSKCRIFSLKEAPLLLGGLQFMLNLKGFFCCLREKHYLCNVNY